MRPRKLGEEVEMSGAPGGADEQAVAATHLRATELFRDLTPAQAALLGTFMERRRLEAGDAVVRAGEAADALYVVESGRATVSVRLPTGRWVEVGELRAGDSFGEVALVTEAPRTAHVIAATPLTVLRLDRASYERCLAELPELELKTLVTAAGRLQAVPEPRAVAVLRALGAGEAAVLGSHMEQRRFAARETIVRRGEPADAFYVIVAGEAKVAGGGEPVRLGPGDFFGEIGLLEDVPRTAEVVAVTPLLTLRLDRDGFEAFTRYSDDAAAAIAETAERRRS